MARTIQNKIILLIGNTVHVVEKIIDLSFYDFMSSVNKLYCHWHSEKSPGKYYDLNRLYGYKLSCYLFIYSAGSEEDGITNEEEKEANVETKEEETC